MSNSVDTITRVRHRSRLDERGREETVRPVRTRSQAEAPTSGTLSTALTAMLGRRIKVTFTNRPRWMTGYDAVVLVLRNRAVQGDMTAVRLLTELMKCASLIGRDGLDDDAAPVPTPAEKELADAFVERSLERARNDAAPKGSPTGKRRRRNGV